MNKVINKNTILHEPSVYRRNRELMNSHRSVIVWFTGLSGAEKSTLAYALEDHLYNSKIRTYIIDGDNIRTGLCKYL